MSEQTLSFPERSDPNGFQVKDSNTFSKVSDSSRKLKRKKTPEYRRINKYFKSTKQYWKERNRRKKAYELYFKGLTYEQIAKKLDVSSKTVSSDLEKTWHYYKGRVNSALQQIQAERDAEYTKQLEGLSLAEQAKRLHKLTDFYLKMHKTRQNLKDTMTLKVDLDEMFSQIANKQEYGRPFVTLYPKSIYVPLRRLRLEVLLKMHGRTLVTSTHSFGDFKN